MKTPRVDPFALVRLQTQAAVMLMEAGTVIWLRSLGMAGWWNTPAGEKTRMATEKQTAFARAAGAAAVAAMTGRSADRTLSAALGPVARKTHSNVRRLARRGPFRK